MIFPVILSGGSGSRLWPVSREHYPKQFLNLHKDDRSLLQEAAERLKMLKIPTLPWWSVMRSTAFWWPSSCTRLALKAHR